MAYIKFNEPVTNCRTNAILSFAGPIAESGIAIISLIMYMITGEAVCLVLFFLGFFLSLVNLIPASPLDGGAIAGAINPKIWFIGITILILLFIYDHEPLILGLIFIAALDCHKTMKNHNDDQYIEYYQIDRRSRFTLMVLYFSTVTMLLMALIYLHYVVNIKTIFLELLKI